MEWNGKTTPHLCLMKKKKNTDWGGKTKKKQISKSPQHMETGSEEEEVLTGYPCGFWLVWVWGWRQRCVFLWKSHACLYSILLSMGLQVRSGWQGLLRKGLVAPEVADIQQSVSLLGGRWQLSDSNLHNTIASEDGVGGKNARVYVSHWFLGPEISGALITWG